MSRPRQPGHKPVLASASAQSDEPAKRAQDGRKSAAAARTPAQERLIEDNIPFVRSIARKLREQMPGIEFDDLVGFGIQGLIEAAQRYDDRHGAVFSTFAYYRIRGAMFDGVRTMGWLPRNEYARVRFEERASRYLEQLAEQQAAERGSSFDAARPEPEPDKDSPEQHVQELARAIHGVATVFVTLLGSVGEEALLDERPAAHEQLERHQLGQRIRRVLQTLPEKERRLIDLYYFGDQTLEQVGASLGLSKSWASRLHARAVALLRDGLLQEDG